MPPAASAATQVLAKDCLPVFIYDPNASGMENAGDRMAPAEGCLRRICPGSLPLGRSAPDHPARPGAPAGKPDDWNAPLISPERASRLNHHSQARFKRDRSSYQSIFQRLIMKSRSSPMLLRRRCFPPAAVAGTLCAQLPAGRDRELRQARQRTQISWSAGFSMTHLRGKSSRPCPVWLHTRLPGTFQASTCEPPATVSHQRAVFTPACPMASTSPSMGVSNA